MLAVSGIEKVHAIVGGFHLVPPQTREQALETVRLMQALEPNYIIPGTARPLSPQHRQR